MVSMAVSMLPKAVNTMAGIVEPSAPRRFISSKPSIRGIIRSVTTTFGEKVVVTDLMMPRMDGFELMKRLGADGNMPPAIVLTAFGNIETAIQTIHDLGA